MRHIFSVKFIKGLILIILKIIIDFDKILFNSLLKFKIYRFLIYFVMDRLIKTPKITTIYFSSN